MFEQWEAAGESYKLVRFVEFVTGIPGLPPDKRLINPRYGTESKISVSVSSYPAGCGSRYLVCPISSRLWQSICCGSYLLEVVAVDNL